ncbi:hypothetical protein ACIOHC_10960 [Streptomyces sp. NPDC088252]|uniref:hypothetical protein n=1 Tax=unclassified Streptomyces TaxID=2593676 RepID=UPI003803A59F
MAKASFALNAEPHVAEIGDDLVLEFRPEIMGDEFLDAYEKVREAAEATDGQDTSTAAVREANHAVRAFLARMMLPESAERFAEVQLPTRIIGELLEWTMTIYGGGRPSGSSSGSATASPPRGTRGTGSSRSKASTSTRGR